MPHWFSKDILNGICVIETGAENLVSKSLRQSLGELEVLSGVGIRNQHNLVGSDRAQAVPNLFWRELPFEPDRQVVGLRIPVPLELMTQDRIRHATGEGPPPQFSIRMPHECSRTGAKPGELLSQFSHLAGSSAGPMRFRLVARQYLPDGLTDFVAEELPLTQPPGLAPLVRWLNVSDSTTPVEMGRPP